MRSLLLTALVLFAAGNIQAQVFEGAIGGGISMVGTPKGLPGTYQGSKTVLNPSLTAQFHYNLSDYWQIGGAVNSETWSRTGNWDNTNPFGATTTSKSVTYVIANPAISFCARVNRVIPFYSPINPEIVQSAIYIGASAGMVFAVNDGQTQHTSDSYVKQFDLENGKGYTLGLQAGYTYYYKRHLALFGEVSPMFAEMRTSDSRDAHDLQHYHLTYLTINIGIRYRWGYNFY